MRIAYILTFLISFTFLYSFQVIQFVDNKIIISLFPSDLIQIETETTFNVPVDEKQIKVSVNIEQINRLFVQVAKEHVAIQRKLTKQEISDGMKLQRKIHAIIIAKQEEQKKEYLQEKREEKADLVTSANDIIDEANDNATDIDDHYEDLEFSTKLESNDFIKRAELIKILKLEKFRLHNKVMKGKVTSVRTLFDKYDADNLVKDR